MTCIVAVHEAGVGTWVGSDSLCTNGTSREGNVSKWSFGPGYAIGVTGHVVSIDMVRHHIKRWNAKMTSHEVWETMRKLCDKNGHPHDTARDEKGAPVWRDIGFIWATVEGAWSFSGSGGAVTRDAGELIARGSGREFAEGAFHGLGYFGKEVSVQNKVRAALLAAIHYDTACGGPLFIHCIGSGPFYSPGRGAKARALAK